ncbi:MAG: AAA family ATPase [Acidobacteriota bacterium]|nr:AAA family ATPase [Acidobacteriota bacterium]
MAKKRPAAALPRTASGLEINPEFGRALEIMETTDKPVFITGRAGTGKSTLLDHFRSTTRKRVAVLAPTGVAALNVRGQTIHSFCRFKPDVTLDTVKALPKAKAGGPEGALYRNLDAVVIDEVSMVRADLLDCVEKFLRLNGPLPKRRFGGIQMVFIGDLYQLPPVVTPQEKALFEEASGSPYDSPYFFSARALADGGYPLEFVELEKIYRQSEAEFIRLLNAIRNRSVSESDLERLNARLDPEFEPAEGEFYITLTSTNDQAFRRNRETLETLDGETFAYDGLIDGEFDRTSLPTDARLEIKTGAQVMLLTNDPRGRWVNGTIGKVIDVARARGEDDVVEVELQDGEIVDIGPNVWEIFRFAYDREENRIVSDPVGAFTQYPLKLAWAVTIHKSQGKTFDRVIVDVGRGTFAHGQVYVALSRCTTFEGLILRKPIRKEHIRMDWRVVRFLTGFQYARSEARLAYGEKRRLIEEAIAEGRALEIVYLKPDDSKSRRRIRPESLEPMEYGGRRFEGLRAWCYEREDIRHFRIERMLEIKVL